MQDDVWLSTSCELTNCDGLPQSLMNRHQLATVMVLVYWTTLLKNWNLYLNSHTVLYCDLWEKYVLLVPVLARTQYLRMVIMICSETESLHSLKKEWSPDNWLVFCQIQSTPPLLVLVHSLTFDMYQFILIGNLIEVSNTSSQSRCYNNFTVYLIHASFVSVIIICQCWN